jgi:hypothetical protein
MDGHSRRSEDSSPRREADVADEREVVPVGPRRDDEPVRALVGAPARSGPRPSGFDAPRAGALRKKAVFADADEVRAMFDHVSAPANRAVKVGAQVTTLQPQPYRLNVPDEVLEDLRERLGRTR